jgi:GNAT superfamily N-acetyltransferase
MTYRIRAVDGADPEVTFVLHSLHKETFGDSAELPDTTIGHWWIAYAGKEPVAFAGVQSARTPDCGYLVRSGVLKAHRGHGLQVRLLRAREKQARKNGWKYLLTDTTNNIPSSNSLIRAGFHLFEPKYRWAFDCSLYWEKELN